MLKNIGSNWLLMLCTAATVYILTPFVIGKLGTTAYGLWLVIVSVTGYMNLLRGGMPASSVRSFSRKLADEDQDALNRAVSSSLAIFLIMSCAVVVAGAVIFGIFEVAFTVPGDLRGDSRIALIIVVCTYMLNFPGHVPLTVLEAHDHFVYRNLIQFAALMTRLALTLILLTVNASLPMLALSLLGALVIEVGAGIIMIKRLYPALEIKLKWANKPMMLEIARTGALILVIMLGGQLAYRTDNIVIGSFLVMEAVAIYGLANSLTIQLMESMIAIATVVIPRATKLFATGDMDEARALTMRWSKIAVTLTLAPGIYLLVLGTEFISWWINPELGVPAGELILIILPPFFLYFPARGVCQPVMVAAGKLRIPAVAALGSGIINLCISLALVGPLKLKGVAMGTAIPTGVLGVLLMILACREVGASLFRYMAYVYIRNLIGAAPSVGFLLWCKYTIEPTTFLSLFLIGIVMLIIYGISSVLLVYTGDPYLDVTTKFRQIGRKLRRR